MACVVGLDRLPEGSHPHIWADWTELLCLTSADLSVSRGELEDRIAEREEIEGEIDEDAWRGAEDTDPVLPSATPGDRRLRHVNDILGQIRSRQIRFGADYPFELSETGATISVRTLTNRRRLYVFLLLAASQRYIARRRQSALRLAFERTAAEAIRGLLPSAAEIHLFGSSASPGTRYRGLLRTKTERLAQDLGERPLTRPEDLAPGDTGDGGLDVVGWIPLGDDLGARVILFVQATCSVEWRAKQSESGFDRWRRRIDFTAQPQNVMCVPFAFRSSTGAWHRRLDIENVVFIDRERLMALLPGTRRRASVLYELVEEASAEAILPFS